MTSLEQALLGPTSSPATTLTRRCSGKAEEILRRAFETVRLMNTAVMNGNEIDGRIDIASTMVRQEPRRRRTRLRADHGADSRRQPSVRTLHENIFASLHSGGGPPLVPERVTAV